MNRWGVVVAARLVAPSLCSMRDAQCVPDRSRRSAVLACRHPDTFYLSLIMSRLIHNFLIQLRYTDSLTRLWSPES